MVPGIYRRRIVIVSTSDRSVADLEDDLHHYRVSIGHDGKRVISVAVDSIRTPWSICTEAEKQLERRLVGMSLSGSPVAVHRHIDSGQQCTHMLDPAGLAVAAAARGISHRQYEITAPFTKEVMAGGERDIYLSRDGKPLLQWRLLGTRLIAPQPCADYDLQTPVQRISQLIPDPDDFEAFVVLRRAVRISMSRLQNLDTIACVTEMPGVANIMGSCYVMQPGNVERAQRVQGASRDFSDTGFEKLVLKE